MSHHYKIRKSTNWKESLGKYLITWQDKKLDWGRADCCIFISGAVEAMTGVNPMDLIFKEAYRSSIEAFSALKRFAGGSSYVDALTRTVSLICRQSGIIELELPSMRMEGDICIIFDNDTAICGVCVGYKTAVMGDNGLIFKDYDNEEIIKVFRVQ